MGVLGMWGMGDEGVSWVLCLCGGERVGGV